MKQSTKLAVGIAAAATAAILVYRLVRRFQHHGRLRRISNEGYETAHDVLYPNHENEYKNLKYGPVLPELI